MRKFLIFTAVLLLTGCGDPYYFAKEGISEEELAQDQFDCLLQIGTVNKEVVRPAELEKLCMKAKGYKVYDGEIPEDIKDVPKE